MIYTILILGLILCLFLKPGDKLGAFTFLSFNIVHKLFFDGNDGFMFCFSMAFLNLGVILLISLLRKTKFIFHLLIVSLGLIFVNLIAYPVWWLCLPVQSINVMYVILYSYSLILIGAADGGLFTLCRRLVTHFSGISSSRVCHTDMEGGSGI